MTYVPDSALLRGLPIGEASCMGMPHAGCRYRVPGDPRSHRVDPGAVCAVCGRPAAHAHHEPPRGMGGRNCSFLLATPMGQFVLLPALIALCGTCHDARHRGPLRFEWAWGSDSDALAWWDGTLLSHGYMGNSPALYGLGKWRAVNADTGAVIAEVM